MYYNVGKAAINNPPKITIYRWHKHSQMVDLWHCFTHIIHISWLFSQLQPNNAQLFQIPTDRPNSSNQWEFQDPRVEVLYHIRPYFVGKFPYIGLKITLLRVIPTMTFQNSLLTSLLSEAFVTGLLPN